MARRARALGRMAMDPAALQRPVKPGTARRALGYARPYVRNVAGVSDRRGRQRRDRDREPSDLSRDRQRRHPAPATRN